MKKILLTLSLCLVALAGMAQKQYTEKVAVRLNGEPFPEATSVITVTENADGTCRFVLPNFALSNPDPEGESMYVGTIDVAGVTMTPADGYSRIAYKGDIYILPGDTPADAFWIGPMLENVPLDLNGKLTDQNLYCTIHIVMSEEMIVDVTVGSDTSAGIGEVTLAGARQHGGVYTLGGVRVADAWSAALPKGIYVVNGKKVIK